MKVEFLFNGDCQFRLTPENEKDWKLLDLAFNGNVVKEIKKPVRDSNTKESLTIVLGPESDSSRDFMRPPAERITERPE